MKDNYIKEQIELKEKELKKLEKTNDYSEKIGKGIKYVLIGVGIISLFSSVGLALAFGSAAAYSYYYEKRNKQVKEKKIETVKEEQKYMEARKTQIPNPKAEYFEKRNNKIKTLKESKELIEDDYEKTKKISLASSAATIGGTILTCFVPGLFFIPVAGAIATYINGRREEKQYEEKEELGKQIKSLEEDQTIAKLVIVDCKKEMQRRQSINNTAKQTTRAKTYTTEQERQIDNYLNSIEKIQDINSPKQKVKK